MTKGAPDHHSTLEVKIDELVVTMEGVKDAIDNLKVTLTNLNIMPPVAETPWAMKYIGRAIWVWDRDIAVGAGAFKTLFNTTGSGQVLGINFRAACVDIQGRQQSFIRIKVDGILRLYLPLVDLFLGIPVDTTWLYETSGVFINDNTEFGFYYNIPIHYSSSIIVEVKNAAGASVSTISYFVAYSNLP